MSRQRDSTPDTCRRSTRTSSKTSHSTLVEKKKMPTRAGRKSRASSRKQVLVEDIEIIDSDNSIDTSDSCAVLNYSPGLQTSALSPEQKTTVSEYGPTETNKCQMLLEDEGSGVQSLPAVPKKTAKRGLAKKQSQLSTSAETSTTHVTSVYSQCVPENFKRFVQDDRMAEVITSESLYSNPIQKNDSPSPTSCERIKHSQASQQVESEMGDNLETSLIIRSPTPPPQKAPPKVARMNRKLSKALNALNEVKGRLEKGTPPPRKGRKKKSMENDVIITYEEAVTELLVKVQYLATVHRLKMNVNDPFRVLVSRVGKEINEDEQFITLYLRDQQLKSSETPRSIGLTVADIIECHCIKHDKEEVDNADVIDVVIRMSNKSKTTCPANKHRPIQDLINKFASIKNLDPSSIVFSFDGEEMDPMDCPFSLDMEDGDCIDVSC
ncbi:hypothetical protein Btru_002216 [Bulinus truncatus]|nr:hypothetical protein Btru_002216 [Bulinus truncatus]